MKLNKGTFSSRRPVLVGVLVVAWLAILVGGAVPAWRRALQQHREVRQVEALSLIHISEPTRPY